MMLKVADANNTRSETDAVFIFVLLKNESCRKCQASSRCWMRE
jgi:hypothetical protein